MSNVYELEILGRQLRVTGESERVLPWLNGYWSFPRYHGLLKSDFAFGLEVSPTRPPVWPTEPPELISIADQSFFLWQSATTTWLEATTCGLSYGPESGQITFWGEVSPSAHTLLYNALSEMLAFSGLLPLHASVAAHNGFAVAFLGPSGRGKTTTLRKAMEAGWQVVAEDTAWIEPLSQQAYGWDKGVRILPADFERWRARFPDLEGGPLVLGKHFVPYRKLGVEPGPTQLIRYTFLKQSNDLSWRMLTTKEAALQLWDSVGLPVHQQVRPVYNRMITQIIRSAECFELALGVLDQPFAAMPPLQKAIPPTTG